MGRTDAHVGRGAVALLVLASLAAAHRIVYVVGMASRDVLFHRLSNDGEYYVRWATALLGGAEGPAGAYYLAPLYPHVLAGLFAIAGSGVVPVYLFQHAVSVAAACWVARRGRAPFGEGAALVAAALLLFHQPLIFFATRVAGETVAISLLLVALVERVRGGRTGAIAAPALLGLATLARPNLLLVAAAWVAIDAVRRRPRRACVTALVFVAVLVPVAVRNAVVSGHLVPVSANGGITLFHGNQEGARGVYTARAELSGDVNEMRAAATALASARAGRPLDDVEADAWWGRLAVRHRLEAGWAGNARLVVTRAGLALSNHEIGLESWPTMDRSAASPILRLDGGAAVGLVPFALLLGLAGAALFDGEWRSRVGLDVWATLAASAVTLLVFYVSSRYRLPVSALLCVPAGVALSSLARRDGWRRWSVASGAVLAGASFLLVPLAEPTRDAAAYWRTVGAVRLEVADPAGAVEAARRSVALAPEDRLAWTVLGEALDRSGDRDGAEAALRHALELADGAFPPAGRRLAALRARSGDVEGAIFVLSRLTRRVPYCEGCLVDLVALRVATGDARAARADLETLRARGFEPPEELLAAVAAMSDRGDR